MAVAAAQTDDGVDVLDVAQLLAELLGRPAWHADAKCRGRGPDPFFPTRDARREPTRSVRRACRDCPVREPCLAFALGRGSLADHGVWGGTSEDQRRHARRRGLTAEQLLAEIDARAG